MARSLQCEVYNVAGTNRTCVGFVIDLLPLILLCPLFFFKSLPDKRPESDSLSLGDLAIGIAKPLVGL